MRYVIFTFLLLLQAILLPALPAWSQAVVTGNPLLDELTNVGLATPVPQGDKVLLPGPTIRDGMTAQEQQAALLPIAKPLGEKNFFNGTVSGKHSYKLTEVKTLADKSKVRSIAVYFVASGTLKDVVEDKLLEDVIPKQAGNKNPGIPEDSRELSNVELEKAGLAAGKQEDGSTVGYSTAQANLIDKVYLDIVTKSQTTQTDESLILATRVAPDVALAAGLPSTWQPIIRVKNVPTIAAPKADYRGAAGYAKVTPLKGENSLLLVEIHVVFIEPDGWFRGANLLGGKMSTVVSDAVPNFRRKLAKAAANKPVENPKG